MNKFVFLTFFSFIVVAQNNFNEYGQREGLWQGYHPNGVLKYEGSFSAGQEVGVFNYYNYSGTLVIRLDYIEPGIRSKAIIYGDNGIVNSEGEYVNKKKNNLWIYYDENTNVISKANYLRGVLEGEYVNYHSNGVKSEVYLYKDGKKNGKGYVFYPSGYLNIECDYYNDQLHGEAKFYYNNRDTTLESLGNYFMGLKDSVWQFYDDMGQINKIIKYDRGLILYEE